MSSVAERIRALNAKKAPVEPTAPGRFGGKPKKLTKAKGADDVEQSSASENPPKVELKEAVNLPKVEIKEDTPAQTEAVKAAAPPLPKSRSQAAVEPKIEEGSQATFESPNALSPSTTTVEAIVTQTTIIEEIAITSSPSGGNIVAAEGKEEFVITSASEEKPRLLAPPSADSEVVKVSIDESEVRQDFKFDSASDASLGEQKSNMEEKQSSPLADDIPLPPPPPPAEEKQISTNARFSVRFGDELKVEEYEYDELASEQQEPGEGSLQNEDSSKPRRRSSISQRVVSILKRASRSSTKNRPEPESSNGLSWG